MFRPGDGGPNLLDDLVRLTLRQVNSVGLAFCELIIYSDWHKHGAGWPVNRSHFLTMQMILTGFTTTTISKDISIARG